MRKTVVIGLAVTALLFSSLAEAGGYRRHGHHRHGYHGGYHCKHRPHWRGHHYRHRYHNGYRYRGHYSPQRYRWEGFALGLGTAIVGSALIHSTTRYAAAPPPPPTAGHWEIRQVWIPPVTKRIWQNGYRDQNGRWVPGQWVQAEQSPGRWESRQVWVVP
jgi:hypothetical protein